MAVAAPTVAIIHASEASMAPATQAFADAFPEARLWHLLDNRLVSDADQAGGLTPELHRRMSTLIQYAVDGGADAVQLACSMYGPVAVDADAGQSVTILASDQAMFDHVVAIAPSTVGVLSSLPSAAADSAERLSVALTGAGVRTMVVTETVAGAAEAAKAGDLGLLTELIVQGALDLSRRVDLLVLAQYSLAPTLGAIAMAIPVPVLSPPHMAASTLAEHLGGGRQ